VEVEFTMMVETDWIFERLLSNERYKILIKNLERTDIFLNSGQRDVKGVSGPNRYSK
jgi:hypothetical protein